MSNFRTVIRLSNLETTMIVGASLGYHVADIFLLCPGDQMIWTATWFVVACMANDFPPWVKARGEPISDSVSELVVTAIYPPCLIVAVSGFPFSDEYPAITRFIDSRPESRPWFAPALPRAPGLSRR